jgi:hypothetical protein
METFHSFYYGFYCNSYLIGLLFTVHKAHREELECVLQVLEKVLVYLPELLSRRWQCHSLTRIMTKLLHPGNSWKLRREAIRYSLLTICSLPTLSLVICRESVCPAQQMYLIVVVAAFLFTLFQCDCLNCSAVPGLPSIGRNEKLKESLLSVSLLRNI